MDNWDDISQIQTDGQRIVDPQSGEICLIRKYDFKFHPLIAANKELRPKKKDILTKDYIKHLENQLWADAWELHPDATPNPRVVIKANDFSIFAICKPKKGNIIPRELLEQVNLPLEQRLIEKDNG